MPTLVSPTTVSYRRLGREEELELAEAMRLGDADARRRLIESQAGLAMALGRTAALRYHHDVDEAQAVGLAAIVEWIDRFDPDRGMRLSTYLHSRIRWAIADHAKAYRGPATRPPKTSAGSRDAWQRAGKGEPVSTGLVVERRCWHSDDGVTAEQLRHAIGQLAPPLRSVIRHRLCGRTVRQIASLVGASKSTVMRRELEACEVLREKLQAVAS